MDLPLLERRVAAHMRFLASDALNGRGSGTRDEWIAATYIGAQLAALGLEPMGDDGWFVQEVAVQRFKASTPPVLTAGDRTYTRNTAFLVGAVVCRPRRRPAAALRGWRNGARRRGGHPARGHADDGDVVTHRGRAGPAQGNRSAGGQLGAAHHAGLGVAVHADRRHACQDRRPVRRC